MRHLVPALAVLAACDGTSADSSNRDSEPPQLEVTSPARGTMTESAEVTVQGRVIDPDSDHVTVEVNGAEVAVGPGGEFSTQLSVAPGLTLIHTQAIDGGGNQASDSRALLSGRLSPHGEVVGDALFVRFNEASLEALGHVAGAALAQSDLGALLGGPDPVFSKSATSCLAVQLFIDQIDISSADVVLRLANGGIGYDVTFNEVDARLPVAYELACFAGNTTVHFTADRIRVTGLMSLDVSDGQVVASISDSQAVVSGFVLDVGSLSSSVVNLFQNQIDNVMAFVFERAVDLVLPGVVEKVFGNLGSTHRFTVNGGTFDLRLAATKLDLTSKEGLLTVSSTATPADATGPGFLRTPGPLPELDRDEGLQLAAADDMLNQILAAAWVGGAMTYSRTFSEDSTDPVGRLFARIDVRSTLPPLVIAEGEEDKAHATIGDILVDVWQREPTLHVVKRVALTATLTLALDVSPEGTLIIERDKPVVWADILDEEAGDSIVLSEEAVADLAAFAIERSLDTFEDTISSVQIPGFDQTEVTSTFFQVTPGYLHFGGDLELISP